MAAWTFGRLGVWFGGVVGKYNTFLAYGIVSWLAGKVCYGGSVNLTESMEVRLLFLTNDSAILPVDAPRSQV